MEKMREKAEKMRKNIKKFNIKPDLLTEEEVLMMIEIAKKRSDEYAEFMKTHPAALHEAKKK